MNGKDVWGSGLISWWVNEEGNRVEERSGKIRYFFRQGDAYDWDSDRSALISRHVDQIREMFQ